MISPSAQLYRKINQVTANKWFLPLVWASMILNMGLEEGRVRIQCVSTLMAVGGTFTLTISFDDTNNFLSFPLMLFLSSLFKL